MQDTKAFTKSFHPAQTKIMRELLFTPKARFSRLNTAALSTDHFSFHLKRLVNEGLIEKTEGKYRLTLTGKEFAGRLDTETATLEKQAKVDVLIGVAENDKFLIQQRLKEPYFGFHGFITGKIRRGETVFETASREVLEETGLTAKIILAGVKHKMDYDKEKGLLDDKFFFVIRAENPKGKLMEKFEGGRNFWATEKEIASLSPLFDGMEEAIEILKSKNLVFLERKYTVSGF
ncbi:MAG: NUDIX domain-containing protein [bacterium]|nr:NUDIX domain-containing protein [bacterium]